MGGLFHACNFLGGWACSQCNVHTRALSSDADPGESFTSLFRARAFISCVYPPAGARAVLGLHFLPHCVGTRMLCLLDDLRA